MKRRSCRRAPGLMNDGERTRVWRCVLWSSWFLLFSTISDASNSIFDATTRRRVGKRSASARQRGKSIMKSVDKPNSDRWFMPLHNTVSDSLGKSSKNRGTLRLKRPVLTCAAGTAAAYLSTSGLIPPPIPGSMCRHRRDQLTSEFSYPGGAGAASSKHPPAFAASPYTGISLPLRRVILGKTKTRPPTTHALREPLSRRKTLIVRLARGSGGQGEDGDKRANSYGSNRRRQTPPPGLTVLKHVLWEILSRPRNYVFPNTPPQGSLSLARDEALADSPNAIEDDLSTSISSENANGQENDEESRKPVANKANYVATGGSSNSSGSTTPPDDAASFGEADESTASPMDPASSDLEQCPPGLDVDKDCAQNKNASSTSCSMSNIKQIRELRFPGSSEAQADEPSRSRRDKSRKRKTNRANRQQKGGIPEATPSQQPEHPHNLGEDASVEPAEQKEDAEPSETLHLQETSLCPPPSTINGGFLPTYLRDIFQNVGGDIVLDSLFAYWLAGAEPDLELDALVDEMEKRYPTAWEYLVSSNFDQWILREHDREVRHAKKMEDDEMRRERELAEDRLRTQSGRDSLERAWVLNAAPVPEWLHMVEAESPQVKDGGASSGLDDMDHELRRSADKRKNRTADTDVDGRGDADTSDHD